MGEKRLREISREAERARKEQPIEWDSVIHQVERIGYPWKGDFGNEKPG